MAATCSPDTTVVEVVSSPSAVVLSAVPISPSLLDGEDILMAS
eukprot:CAMPEP_0196223286 /NCGR_PEP_ID=MMETSP0912-20130531/46424_1 /TAXON_ID=49265 /ORGANISM="Thalassiosira rotula, Strain GSO102" /LENGTH=42 /DNA_ID= /DNA_START= /DNA_END= /DNA_ORIENTATION=